MKIRIFYIFSLVLIGVLIGFTVFKPMATGGEYSEVFREQLLQTEDGWIIQLDIVNRNDKDITYSIKFVTDGKPYTDRVLIRSGKMTTWIEHITPDELSDGVVTFAVYEEGEDTPFEKTTYYLK